jgi:hypothetical protein
MTSFLKSCGAREIEKIHNPQTTKIIQRAGKTKRKNLERGSGMFCVSKILLISWSILDNDLDR